MAASKKFFLYIENSCLLNLRKWEKPVSPLVEKRYVVFARIASSLAVGVLRFDLYGCVTELKVFKIVFDFLLDPFAFVN